jgi:hypothetical protein
MSTTLKNLHRADLTEQFYHSVLDQQLKARWSRRRERHERLVFRNQKFLHVIYCIEEAQISGKFVWRQVCVVRARNVAALFLDVLIASS